jgi:hypothetical protein
LPLIDAKQKKFTRTADKRQMAISVFFYAQVEAEAVKLFQDAKTILCLLINLGIAMDSNLDFNIHVGITSVNEFIFY